MSILRIGRIAAATFVIGISGFAAFAKDVALVVGNRDYQFAGRMFEAESALDGVRQLERAGFVVVSGRDVEGREQRRALTEFENRLGDADRVVIQLNGHFVHAGGQTWFLPVDARRPSLGTVSFDAINVNSLLQMAATKPGGAAVFLGTFPRRIELGAGLEAGIGPLDIPQGVFLATGKPEEISAAVRGPFLDRGTSLAAALEAAGDSVTGAGFISSTVALLPEERGGDPAALTEEGYWQLALDLGTREAFEKYLDRYPRGTYASQARNRITDIEEAPRREAQAAERRLRLTRDDRRGVQEDLSLLGYDTRGIDGIFGRGTRAAIGDWQEANGHARTGYLDRAQIAQIRRQAQRRAAELEAEAQAKQEEEDARDTAYWRRTGADGTERGLRRYLRRYPDGLYSDVAQARLDAILDERLGSASRREERAWRDAQDANTVEGYEAYLAAYPDGLFAEQATEKVAALKEEAARAAELEAARTEEDSLAMNILAKILVEKRLNALGLKAGPEDGNFDDATRKAIRRYQKSRGLPVNGYITRATAVRLLAGG